MGENTNHTLLLKKLFSLSNTLTYHRKLKKPILTGKEKCISYLSISGYRNWLNDCEESIIRGNLSSSEYEITIQNGEMGEEKVQIPPHTFLLGNFSEILEIVKMKISEKIQSSDFVFFIIKDNIFSFKVLENDISITFSSPICDFFGFTRGALYDRNCLVSIFAHQTHLLDNKCDMVGIQTNFGFNPELDRDCVGFFFSKNIGWGQYFHEILISQKQELCLKCDSLDEIEIRFINLSTEKIFKSFSYQPDYIVLNLHF